MPPVIVLWADKPARALADGWAQLDAVVVPLDAVAFLGALPTTMPREGVVAVVDDAEAEARALALGADEALCADRAEADLAVAIARARLRASARASREGRLIEELHRADGEALELLVAAVAHELRTPLAVASLNAEMLAEALGPVMGTDAEVTRRAAQGAPPPADELRQATALRLAAPVSADVAAPLDDLSAAVRRAIQIVKKMGALIHHSASDPCDLAAALWEAGALMRGLIEGTAAFVVDIPPSPLRIPASSADVVQIISALLSNAYHACLDIGGGDRRIELRLVAHPWMAVVEVSDNGAGMPREVRQRAFQPFFTTRRPGALGLGLTLASARVRRAGGDIVIASEAGVGTRARVFFPAANAEATPPPPQPPPSSPAGATSAPGSTWEPRG